MTRLIWLTKGFSTIVDDEDYHELSKHKWQVVPSAEKIYAKRRAKKRLGETRDTIMMHRYILSADDEHEVDHINGNSLDNRRCNLRIVTRSENMANRAIFRNNTSG